MKHPIFEKKNVVVGLVVPVVDVVCEEVAVVDVVARANASVRSRSAAAPSASGAGARSAPKDRNRVPVLRGSSVLRSDAFSTGWAPGLGFSASAVCARYASPASSSRDPTKRSRGVTARGRLRPLVASDARGRLTPRGAGADVNAGGGAVAGVVATSGVTAGGCRTTPRRGKADPAGVRAGGGGMRSPPAAGVTAGV